MFILQCRVADHFGSILQGRLEVSEQLLLHENLLQGDVEYAAHVLVLSVQCKVRLVLGKAIIGVGRNIGALARSGLVRKHQRMYYV